VTQKRQNRLDSTKINLLLNPQRFVKFIYGQQQPVRADYHSGLL